MGELLPTLAARSVRNGLLEYLETTFALSDESARLALREFLEHERDGIFKGPYLRLRLPFRPADEGWRDHLGWHPTDDGDGFPPYGHQARAYERLSSLNCGEDRPRPLPTLVTTGTGSGKTEAFLHPILDHVLRAKRDGQSGTKALILYPMNALANDQAQRLADLITTHPSLGGVTAGLYIGQEGPQRTKVSAAGLITDRAVMRSDPPDILLTNYKMLDQLLLRAADQQIWRQSATSLQYLVLDEFHTYDGAQGTDVAMLLRRLGLTLKAFGAPDSGRPLGNLTPVATSATLGDEGDPAAMLAFAETVFGESFPADSVVTESRVSLDEWAGDFCPTGPPRTGSDLVEAVGVAAEALSPDPEPVEVAQAVLPALFEGGLTGLPPQDVIRSHPVVRALIERCAKAQPVLELARDPELWGGGPVPDALDAVRCLELVVGALSHVRAEVGRTMPDLEVHLWVRELTRIDRAAASFPAYRWSDEGGASLGSEDAGERPDEHLFPAIYCRHCGRSGWGVAMSPANSTDLDTTDEDIRRNHAAKKGRFRPILHAPREGDLALSGAGEEVPDNLRWFHVSHRRVSTAVPTGAEARDDSVLPVLTHVGPDADDLSNDDTCPACLQKDGIRFLGSAIATQLSVTLSTLFGSTNLDQTEKKTLVFTDSVQDAAHRAGFVQARSHSLTVRSMLRGAVGDEPVSLDLLAERVISHAGDNRDLRFRVLPPDLAERERFRDFWERRTLAKVPIGVRNRVRRRIDFDAVLEFGLQSRLGRTLELTGAVAAEVQAPAGLMVTAARRAIEDCSGEALLAVDVSDASLRAWVRGTLEHMRERGSIDHPWLKRFIESDGSRYFVWRGRPRSDGMPAFPIGRSAPAFPRVGSPLKGSREHLLDQVTTPQSWYTNWTMRCLSVSRAEASTLARQLLKRLAGHDVLTSTSTTGGGEVYAIAPSSVLVTPTRDDDLRERRHLLSCTVCQGEVPGSRTVVDQLDGAPCLVSRCRGHLERAARRPDDFYRRFYASHEVQRVIAREHTSLLEDKVRQAYEDGFKGRIDDPAAPNVLVATPTLEMGIDIGDLSTVMLASLPRTVSSYLQRVGRAGRLSGSAMDLAFVTGRGQHLPRLGDPLSMIDGKVRPPATYLGAEEILRRQFLASLADRQARDPEGVHPERATGAIGSVTEGSYLHAIAVDGETDRDHLDAFLASFPTLTEDQRRSLRDWTTRGSSAALSSPMAERLIVASQRWRHEVETLGHRIAAIEQELPGLEKLATMPAATDDDQQAFRSAQASLHLAKGQRGHLQGKYWVGVLEEAAVLPNYTLLDDSVTLDVGLSWLDPDSGEYETEDLSYRRNAARALRDFAPGATFYSRGYRAEVSAVDLGNNGESVRTVALCPACGHGADITDTAAPQHCPRCGTAGIADLAQRLDVVELTRASSSMRRDEAVIDDDRDERVRERYDVIAAADVDPANVTRQWFVKGYGFGARHVRGLSLTWLNLGRSNRPGPSRLLAGHQVEPELFRVCAECGHLDRRSGHNNRYEHRPWCRLRDADTEHTRQIALTRNLVTEGLLLRLPAHVALGNSFALPSLAAAIQLGLREQLGGTPDHLSLEWVMDPAPEADQENHDALLLHDLVPGGTGYLMELARPERLRAILHRAYTIVRDCPCADEARLACHRCLLPFAPPSQVDSVSRVEARRLLRDILLAGVGDEQEPEPGDQWEITEQATEAFEPESKLEQKFRAVLHERLGTVGAAIKEIPGDAGIRLDLTVAGRHWVLEPQVLVGGSKPDFILRCDDPGVPQLAIFTDGWRYHASPLHNRVADDAIKRRTLRDLGYVVLAITWPDVSEQQESPGWFSPQALPTVMQQCDLRRDDAALLTRGPIDFLIAWIQSTNHGQLRRIGKAVPWLAATRSSARGAIPDGTPLSVAAARLLDGEPLPSGATAWAWRQDSCLMLSRLAPGGDHAETLLLLDDRESALGLEHAEAWRTWLRLANLLGLPETGTAIAARTEADAAAPTVTGAPTGATEGPTFDANWSPLFDVVMDDEREFLTALARAELPVPAVGEEVDGIPLPFVWADHHVAAADDLTDDETADLEAAGWRVLRLDVASVMQALKEV